MPPEHRKKVIIILNNSRVSSGRSKYVTANQLNLGSEVVDGITH